MVMLIKERYWGFYVEGREAKALKNDIDIEELAASVVSGAVELRAAVRSACEEVARTLEIPKAKRKWIQEHEDEIKEAGGDSEIAHQAWINGRVDELVYLIEPDVVDALAGDGEDGDDEDEDDSEDD